MPTSGDLEPHYSNLLPQTYSTGVKTLDLRVSPSLIFDFRLLNSGMRPTPSDSPYLKTWGQVVGIIDSWAKEKLEQFWYFRHGVTSWSHLGPKGLSWGVKNILAGSNGTRKTILEQQNLRKNKCRFLTIFFLRNFWYFFPIFFSFLKLSVKDTFQKAN